MEIKIASFNLRYGNADDGINRWESRESLCLSQIVELKADILGVQEALSFQIEAVLRVNSAWKWYGLGRDDGVNQGEHSAIFYDFDRFELIEGRTVWLSHQPDIPGSKFEGTYHPRVLSICCFKEKKSGIQFQFLNTHWDNESKEARLFSAKMINALLSETLLPTLLVGDFNAELKETSIQILSLQDVRQALGIDKMATFHGFGVADIEEIDHIFVNDGFTPLSYEICTKSAGSIFPSDHYPICAVVRSN